MKKSLKNYAEKKGWTINKSIAYGEERGYLFTVIQRQRFKKFIVPLTHITDVEQESVKNFLNDQKTELKLHEFGFNNSVLFINVKEVFSLMTEDEINSLLSNLTNFLITNNIGTQKYCVFCGLENPDDQCSLKKIQFHTHNYCYEYYLRSKKKKKKDFARRNYFLGTIGALLGGLIGTIPWFIVSYFGFYASFLGYLIGIASLKGYKTLGGKYGFKTRWIILVCVLFSVVFAELMSYLILLAPDFSLLNLYNIILNNLFNFLLNIGLGFLFAFLGIYRLFKDLGEI
ncbi:hypothetical protein KHQ81_08255 [Mycoplasmatota bacterium]|nr:hypothetical protein KHQ81_08255 [Mycoplasmatota bacterium]